MKKSTGICAIFIIVVLAAAAFLPVHVKADKAYDMPLDGFVQRYGDVNMDGAVKTSDVVTLLNYCADAVYLNAMQLINSDVNCDCKVNTADAIVMMRYLVGAVKELPYTGENVLDGGSLTFRNVTFPGDNERVTYNKSYRLEARITSDYPIDSVRVVITDSDSGTVEIDESVRMEANNHVYVYDTFRSENAIDDRIKFASLSTGKKTIEVFCSNSVESNICVYQGAFRVGFSFSEVAGHVYDKGDDVSSSEARKVLALLNGLDCSGDVGAGIVSTGIGYLGQDYATMDCSKFVQLTISNATKFMLPRVSSDQAKFCAENGYQVTSSQKKPGDLVFMSRNYCDCGRYHEVHHSAIYIGNYDGTDYIIESTSSLGGVVIRRIWGLVSGRWVIDSVARIW